MSSILTCFRQLKRANPVGQQDWRVLFSAVYPLWRPLLKGDSGILPRAHDQTHRDDFKRHSHTHHPKR